MNEFNFVDAVNACAGLLNYHKGLHGLKGEHRHKVKADNNRLIEGSVDIDADYLQTEPQASRWDYAVGYNGKAYFVEIHPADTSNVKVVLNKLHWLKAKLSDELSPINSIKAARPYVWISSGSFSILPNSKAARLCVTNGIVLCKTLNLH